MRKDTDWAFWSGLFAGTLAASIVQDLGLPLWQWGALDQIDALYLVWALWYFTLRALERGDGA